MAGAALNVASTLCRAYLWPERRPGAGPPPPFIPHIPSSLSFLPLQSATHHCRRQAELTITANHRPTRFRLPRAPFLPHAPPWTQPSQFRR
uniref:Uncharacterized protein n=1 Tax=Arundo donax TaxID=35708 RepID=A0A0A8XYN6_ARUDO